MTVKQEAKQTIGSFMEMGMDRPTALKASVFLAEKMINESHTFDRLVFWKNFLKEIQNETGSKAA